MTPFEQKLTALIEPPLDGMGYDLVRVMMRGELRKTLQIMAERQDQRPMTLDDCTGISETVSAVLDVHDPIKERYALEVSSPGIDRPLIKPADFARYAGYEAKIDLKELYQGRRALIGILRPAKTDGNDSEVRIELEKGEIFIAPFDLIHRAKLVLTDALIAEHLKTQHPYETQEQ